MRKPSRRYGLHVAMVDSVAPIYARMSCKTRTSKEMAYIARRWSDDARSTESVRAKVDTEGGGALGSSLSEANRAWSVRVVTAFVGLS